MFFKGLFGRNRRKLGSHMGGPPGVGIVSGFQNIGKEKEFQHKKEDKELYENDGPQRLAERHGAKAVEIEIENTRKPIAAS